MAEGELTQVRAPEPVTITVLRARDLKGQRGETVNALVKVEFGEKSLGESSKVECSPGNPAEFNYQASLSITFEDPLALDEIAYKPVLLTVIEVLPKEKKQRGEERTVTLGQCSVDLLPLVQGLAKQTYSLPIHPLPGSPMENLPAEHPRPELDVSLSVSEPLLTEGQLQDSNLMSITVESLCSPPDSWGLSGPQYHYTATVPVPLSAEKENTIVFAAGQLKPGADKEVPNKQKKWAVPGGALGNAIYINDETLACDAVEDEAGDFKAKEDREHRLVAEQDKNRVTWNIERRCYLESAAVKNFQEKIAKTRYWPVEIVRTAAPSGGKNKKEDDGIGFHGIAYVNVAPLLYPGVQRIRGAYRVVAYNGPELTEKTQRVGSLAEEAVKIASGIVSRSSSSPFQKGGKVGKEDKKEKDPKKGRHPSSMSFHRMQQSSMASLSAINETSAMLRPSDTASDTGVEPPVNVEGQQYVEAKSYIMLEISLRRPLVPKRPPEELAKKVAEYIPPRPLFPKRTDGAQRAVEDFHSQVGQVANLILEEFREQFGDSLAAGELSATDGSIEARRQSLIYHLNSSGKYFAFKEQLKHAVVKIVREKYLKTKTFEDQNELQAFLSELYVYLVDQMHMALGSVLSVEDQTPIPEPLTNTAQLKHFAREAEVNGNFELASKYYQERIARDKNDPDNWFDYGTFCLYISDLTKAEECFKECVSIDQRHLHGLILYGVVCTMQDKHDAAETFFEAATCVDPKSILAWTMLGLFYDGIGNEIGAEMALLEANKLNVAAAIEIAKAQKEQEKREKEREAGEAVKDVNTEAADGKAAADAQSVAESTPAIKQTSASPAASAASGDKPNTATSKGTRLSEKRHSAVGRKSISRPGSTRRSAGNTPQPVEPEPEEPPPPREPTPVPTSTIFMQIIDFLLEVKAMPFTERALRFQLLDPMGGPTSEYSICLARLKLQKNELDEAEIALKEALQTDHQNPDAWAIMGHVKYLVGDTENAKDCYERTLSFMADASETHSIYLRLASIYLQETKFQGAKNTFLMACKRSPSCVSWLGVGIACYRLGELSEAEDALSEANILNNSDPEVWAYLSLVCLKTGRQLEAEQAYKYAMKLNLQDEDLLSEIHKVQEEVGFGNPEL